jgi:hypothetical protein
MSPITSENHFGTIRNPPSNKIQEALNLQVPIQKSAAQRPTNKPPPPPVPNRNINTNLTNQSHAKSTTALNNNASDQSLSAPRRLPNSGSSNNISSIERGNDQMDSSAPPLPPHRMASQRSQQPVPVLSNQLPPEVPRRHSSMRNSIENGANNNSRYPSPNMNNQLTKLVVDLEARYSLLFHSISEFPAPNSFMNIAKSYPSRASANGV